LIFENGRWPLLFLIFPVLQLTAFRTGLLGVTAASTMAGVLATSFTIKGVGPIADLTALTYAQQIQSVQFYVLTIVMSSLLVAGKVSHRVLLEKKLRQQSSISSAALENMSQGLAMFDGSGNLVTCNSKYAKLYRLPPVLTRPGTSRDDINAHIVALGEYDDDQLEHFTKQLPSPSNPLLQRELVKHQSGRIIDIKRQPLPDGGWVATYEDVTDRRNAEARVEHLAAHDPLTGLMNRAGFNDNLQSLLDGRPGGQCNALLLLDVDHFKKVNDTMGHPVGDELLRQIATRLRSTVREGDVVSRLGGDEFAILLRNTNGPDAVHASVKRMLPIINAPSQILGSKIAASMSIGISLIQDDLADPDKLVRQADLALYHAKAGGRATFRFFEPHLEANFLDKINVERELASAIELGQLVLHYQPIASLHSAAITSFEALVRWRHPTRGLLLSVQFIPVAESTGLIRQLGSWVLKQACIDATRWPAGIKVAVNLSAGQFYKNRLVAEVVEVLEATGLDPGRLELELTESTLLEQTEINGATLHELHELGVLLVLDDFGTGFSSLKYLNSFRFHKVKIDRSFAKGAGPGHKSAPIVHAINQLAHALGMEVVAEGVETPEELVVLRAAGCDCVQGYYIGRPRDVTSVAEVLALYNETPSENPLLAGRVKSLQA
ncbi:MAG: EAL domain-containing protein, partial [Aestuariivirga sp.]